MRTKIALVAAVVGPLALLACRDVLGIAGQTTVGDAAVMGDVSIDGVVTADGGVTNTTLCGSLTQITTVTPTTGVFAIAAEGNDLFWVSSTDAESGGIFGWVSGALVTVVQQDVDPVDLRMDSSFVYWNAWNTFNGPQGSPILHAWSRSNHKKVDHPLDAPSGLTAGKIASDQTNLYFGAWLTNGNAGIYALPLPLGDAGVPQKLYGGFSSPYHIAVDSTALSFDDGAGDTVGTTVWSAPLDGGAPMKIRDTTTVLDIVVVNGDTYWATGGGNSIEGPGGFSASVDSPTAFVVEPTKTYFYVISAPSVANATDTLLRVRVADGNSTECAVADTIGALVAVSGHVYFSALAGGVWGIYDLATP